MTGMLDFIFSRGRKGYGGYELKDEIARGGMSRVWRARKPGDERLYAVKVLTPESVEAMSRFKEVFETEEGEIALRLNHPNVIKTYEYGRVGKDAYYIVMEYVDGANLETLVVLDSPRIAAARFELLLQMGAGLQYIHAQGLIHRDFCPKNVLYGADNVAKIIDFGLCVPTVMQERTFMARAGTASYMAPEQVRSQPLDARADIYAYGMSAFEVLTGRRPFPRTQSRSRRMQDHLNIQPMRLRQVSPELPDELDEVVQKCIAKDRQMRYKSMDAVMRDMKAAVEIALSQQGKGSP
jgi:serine/threonine protein kinase